MPKNMTKEKHNQYNCNSYVDWQTTVQYITLGAVLGKRQNFKGAFQ